MSEHVEPVTPTPHPVMPPVIPPAPPTPAEPPSANAAVERAAEAQRKAAAELKAAEDHAEQMKRDEAKALVARADKAEADAPHWELAYRSGMDVTERMVLPGGYLLRSSWRHGGDIGNAPIEGSSLVFVPGEAPALWAKGGTVVLALADITRGVDPERATMDDVVMSPRIAAAKEVLLRMPDGSVRVLKAGT